MLCLFVSAISLASAALLSDSYASDFASSNYWQYEEVDAGEINDLFYPISSDEFFIHRPLFFVTSIFSIGNESHGFPLFYTIRAPPF